MGSYEVDQERKWRVQHKTIIHRIDDLVSRCIKDNMKPSQISMASDLYIQTIQAAYKMIRKEYNPDNIPPMIEIIVSNQKIKLVHDKDLAPTLMCIR